MKYFIRVYGCQMNRSDAERIAGLFESHGARPAETMEDADTIVVMMCSVRQMAVDRVFGLEQKFKALKKKNAGLKTLLTGCVVKTDKPRFSKIFDHILDTKTLDRWPRVIGLKPHSVPDAASSQRPGRCEAGFSTLIPISKGCDNYCSYCVVPYTRGALVSRPAKNILDEVRQAVESGAKEIWLLGQNVNNYHSGKVNFARLLEMVDKIPGDFWIRFTSPHPRDFSDEAAEAMAKCLKVTPYLNLPIQSGDDGILKAMNRPYTVKIYENLVKRIRAAFKKYRHGLERNVAISTDVIVGFPGETKVQFENTAKTFTAVKYDMAYIAQYSKRAGTAAARLDDNVPQREKKRRQEAINNILKKTALGHNKKYIGKTVDVLVDSIKNGCALGKTRSYKTVKAAIGENNVRPGDIIRVKIAQVMAFVLIGKILNE